MNRIMSAKNIGVMGVLSSSICLLNPSDQSALFLMLGGMSLVLCGLGLLQGVLHTRTCITEDALFCRLTRADVTVHWGAFEIAWRGVGAERRFYWQHDHNYIHQRRENVLGDFLAFIQVSLCSFLMTSQFKFCFSCFVVSVGIVFLIATPFSA